MNRRASLAKLLGQTPSRQKKVLDQLKVPASTAENKTNALTSSGLEPYVGPWGIDQAAHLLRRTTFGPTYQQIKSVAANGLEVTLLETLTNPLTSTVPVNDRFPNDPFVAIGEPWIDIEYPIFGLNPTLGNQVRAYRRDSLAKWQMGLLLENTISIREKMTLFWHNHFPVADIPDGNYIYHYGKTLRDHCLGNFKELVKAITLEPGMLRYLNGRENTNQAPNENYARELFELFTIGKGPQVGAGDYTTFTEQDVAAAAKVLTGWRDIGLYCEDLDGNNTCEFGVVFIPGRHDNSSKTFSHRFDNTVINPAGDQEYANLVDMIFTKDACARFICRKLYRWFVYYQITDEIEANVIEPMAQLVIDNDYDILPALRALLRSAHFYDLERIGCQIKNPIDYTISMVKAFGITIADDLETKYASWAGFYFVTSLMQMQYYQPPSVSGWNAYYQAPSYYQLWINSVTLTFRYNYGLILIFLGFPVLDDDNNTLDTLRIDPLEFINSLDNPGEINALMDELNIILFSRSLSAGQKTVLKQVLIPGLPDFEWNVEYGIYQSDPNNADVINSISNKVRNLLWVMLNMPEYQLI